ncbi:molybdenum cofactor synthesis protein 3 [Glomus cerebriforme]|uniref:Needs CLA4 to survive protein 3 n=1 Tax=Glomus cerebriforme TaxID=658196 RepID=A0A397SRL7_9GLOM|nr:molybdenum cofactor synthesis protein 3 [Glomus cerebriforme]
MDKSEIQLLMVLNSRLKEENEQLKIRVKELEEKLDKQNSLLISNTHNESNSRKTCNTFDKDTDSPNLEDLTLAEYMRYGRQLILPGFGKTGQLKLKNTSMLIVGAGGLGAPAAIYLAATGVGKLGIIDHDTVEKSNLQRQIIHNESREGISKAQSAKMTIEELNSLCKCVAYEVLLDSSNALEIVKKYDIVIDATDNVATRYLLNDVCVIAGKPLVSGSALRMDGQLTVYNYKRGPCYRCLFPKPPPPESILNCADGGVLGVVTGIIGCLQALQAIKIAIENDESPNNLLIFSATSYPLFRSMKLRSKKKDCGLCGEHPFITELQDYVQFCGSGALDKSPSVKLLGYEDRIEPKTYRNLRNEGTPHVLIDVRETVQYDICSLPSSINIPLKDLPSKIEEVKKSLEAPNTPVYVICRLGNDSQHAVNILKNYLKGEVKDIIGGLYKWSLDVDPDFPIY